MKLSSAYREYKEMIADKDLTWFGKLFLCLAVVILVPIGALFFREDKI